MRGGAALMIFGLLLPLPDDAERLFEEARGLLAIGALEPHGVDEDVAPSFCALRWTKWPRLRASIVVLWMP